MNGLLIAAIALALLWVAAQVLGWALGVAIHLVLLVAAVLFVLWVMRKAKART